MTKPCSTFSTEELWRLHEVALTRWLGKHRHLSPGGYRWYRLFAVLFPFSVRTDHRYLRQRFHRFSKLCCYRQLFGPVEWVERRYASAAGVVFKRVGYSGEELAFLTADEGTFRAVSAVPCFIA